MAVAEDITVPVLEQVVPMGTVSGDAEHFSSISNRATRRGICWIVILWLRGLLTEQVQPETQSKENKGISVVAGIMLTLNYNAITTVTTNNDFFGQVVLILSTLSFVLSIILIVVAIAMPAVSLVKLKRIVLVSAICFTVCSFLAYVAKKMGHIAGTAAAAIFFAGAFVFSVTILFLIPTVYGAPSASVESSQLRSSQQLLASDPVESSRRRSSQPLHASASPPSSSQPLLASAPPPPDPLPLLQIHVPPPSPHIPTV